MTVAPSSHRLAPIASWALQPRSKILLGDGPQPTLLRYLEGWPTPPGMPRAFQIHFVEAQGSLAGFADDSFDLAVLQAPSAECLEEVVRQLTRVARQGVILRRRTF